MCTHCDQTCRSCAHQNDGVGLLPQPLIGDILGTGQRFTESQSGIILPVENGFTYDPQSQLWVPARHQGLIHHS